ncbi:MAG: hypothetical protein LPK21_07895 [Hymenobacteraceae bacterium]|nr:hypothetical protein [Hymenobacteraceae bacterium]
MKKDNPASGNNCCKKSFQRAGPHLKQLANYWEYFLESNVPITAPKPTPTGNQKPTLSNETPKAVPVPDPIAMPIAV